MKATISINDFERTLKKIDKLSVPKHTMDTMDYYKITVLGDGISIIKSTIDVTVIGKVEGYAEQYGYVCIHKDIVKLIRKLKVGKMVITEDKITIGTKEINLDRYKKPGHEYIDMKYIEEGSMEAFKVTENELLRLFKTIYVTDESDLVRPVLTTLCISDNEVCCMSSYRISVRNTNQFNLADTIKKELIIKYPVIKYINKILDSSSRRSLMCYANEKQVKFVINDITVISELFEGKYLNYRGMIPSIDEAQTIVKIKEPKDFYNSLKFVNELKKDKKESILIMTIHDYTLFMINNFGDAKDHTEDVFVDGKDIKIACSNDYIIDAVEQYKDYSLFNIYMFNANSPIIISKDDKGLEMMLPVRLLNK